jgi:hypothetical protein
MLDAVTVDQPSLDLGRLARVAGFGLQQLS